LGYWLQIDFERRMVIVHSDASMHHRCAWLGKKAGRPQPANWRYEASILGSSLVINNAKFSLKPCSLPQCMNGALSVPIK
jgi:hypothetical protein